MHRIVTILLGALLVASLVGWAGTACDLRDLNAQHREATTERDSLALTAAADRARADGWEVAFAERTGDLNAVIAELDENGRRLATDLRASRVQVTQLAEVVGVMRGQIVSQGTVVADSASGDSTAVGRVNDPPLDALWTFHYNDQTLGLDWVATFEAQWITSVGGDGRTMVTARALSPNTEIAIPTLFVEPLPPDTVEVTRWKAAIVAGTLTAALLTLLFGGD